MKWSISFFHLFTIFCQITAVNCIWAQWGAWERCSKTCGDAGSKQRIRGKKRVEKNGGTCDGQPTETEQDCAYDWGTNGCPPQRKKCLFTTNDIWVKLTIKKYVSIFIAFVFQ